MNISTNFQNWFYAHEGSRKHNVTHYIKDLKPNMREKMNSCQNIQEAYKEPFRAEDTFRWSRWDNFNLKLVHSNEKEDLILVVHMHHLTSPCNQRNIFSKVILYENHQYFLLKKNAKISAKYRSCVNYGLSIRTKRLTKGIIRSHDCTKKSKNSW